MCFWRENRVLLEISKYVFTYHSLSIHFVCTMRFCLSKCTSCSFNCLRKDEPFESDCFSLYPEPFCAQFCFFWREILFVRETSSHVFMISIFVHLCVSPVRNQSCSQTVCGKTNFRSSSHAFIPSTPRCTR